jgi:hypothetical protein
MFHKTDEELRRFAAALNEAIRIQNVIEDFLEEYQSALAYNRQLVRDEIKLYENGFRKVGATFPGLPGPKRPAGIVRTNIYFCYFSLISPNLVCSATRRGRSLDFSARLIFGTSHHLTFVFFIINIKY